MNQPIFITGVERSGSTLIAKIIEICGAFTGSISTMCENYGIKLIEDSFVQVHRNGELMPDIKELTIPTNWKDKVQSTLLNQGYKDGVWMYKSSQMSQIWAVWHYAYPNARWIIVRRKTPDIVHSCIKTGFMKTFKDQKNRGLVGVLNEEDGWKWWIHQYEKRFIEIIEYGVDCKQVWPERMVHGNYQQIYEMLEWLGLKWNSKIVETIDPMLIKSRRK